MRRETLLALALMAAALLPGRAALALDPPHDLSNLIVCLTCHTPHGALGSQITRVEGNSNLCMSCHNPTAIAAGRPFSLADQALPGVRGTSHRWDSGPSGHVDAALSNTSPGRINSLGVFTGRIEKAYTITIATAGDAAAARFNWSDGQGGSGTNLPAGPDVALADGLRLSFSNGAASPSFRAGDSWQLHVRTDLRLPDPGVVFEAQMSQRVVDGKVSCSVCHDQHSQELTPFDPAAPPFAGPGTGAGRHFQRAQNNANQMCKTCHSARDVAASAQGSHPVGVVIPARAGFQAPAALPLDAEGKVQCMSCHRPHFADSGGANGGLGDGYLLRLAIGDLCDQCHTLADRPAGAHFSASTGGLWPGGQYGSSFPAHTTEKRGACVNCHWPHGWPDNRNIAQDFNRLWVERYNMDTTAAGTVPHSEDLLCMTCHDGAPATSNIKAEWDKTANGAGVNGDIFHHPVKDAEQQPGRTVECVDCHNPHQARSTDRHAGVSGVDLAGAAIAAGSRQLQQYELCFKCHGDTFSSARPNTSNKRLDFNTTAANSGYHPVTQPGRGLSANLTAQLQPAGLTTASTIRCTDCHNSNAFSTTLGPVADSAANTVGPHGSTFAPILRANFARNFTATGWNDANANLCFRCHDPVRLLSRDQASGARTNFSDESNPAGGRGKRNLHWYHLTDRGATASCMSCHYDIHSNRSAGNTEYCVGTSIDSCTVTTSPPANVKTHLVNFAPDVTRLNFPRPRWHINTTTGVRSCDVTCHGSSNKMDRVTYRPSAGDETSHTY